MLLSTAYFPPLEWFALAARGGKAVQLEACENYRKQSWRNRCHILASDGVQMLQVPVIHGHGTAITEIRVDYSTPWLLRTQRALDTAYLGAAFYEHYRDSLFPLMELRPETLWDWNHSLLEWCLEKTGIETKLIPTDGFALPGSVPDDYRYAIDPKKENDILRQLGLERPYYQVFRDKMGVFVPGLSILDLLFNEGPDSILWLKRL